MRSGRAIDTRRGNPVWSDRDPTRPSPLRRSARRRSAGPPHTIRNLMALLPAGALQVLTGGRALLGTRARRAHDRKVFGKQDPERGQIGFAFAAREAKRLPPHRALEQGPYEAR